MKESGVVIESVSKGRKHFLDNIRWVVVLSVLFFHVIFYYHAQGGYFGTVGGFKKRQWQDLFMYCLHPWFMMSLFMVAGVSSRYALQRQTHVSFLKSRTRKLLLPCTLGLFFIGWIRYYYLALAIEELSPGDSIFKIFSGIRGLPSLCEKVFCLIGHLWFVIDLWLFSVLIVFLRWVEKDRLYAWIGRLFSEGRKDDGSQSSRIPAYFLIVFGGLLLVWIAVRFSDLSFRYQWMTSWWYRLYFPIKYFTAFLLGYFVFSHDIVQERVAEMRISVLAVALIVNICFSYKYWDAGIMFIDFRALDSLLGNAAGWLTMLALMGCFKAWADKTNRFAAYMTKASYGIYVIHYLVIAVVGYYMKAYTALPPWAMYLIMTVAVFTLSPLLYEIIRRIPFVRWCVFGMKLQKNK